MSPVGLCRPVVGDRLNFLGDDAGELGEYRVRNHRLGVDHLFCLRRSHRRGSDRTESDPKPVVAPHYHADNGCDHHGVSGTDLCELLSLGNIRRDRDACDHFVWLEGRSLDTDKELTPRNRPLAALG